MNKETKERNGFDIDSAIHCYNVIAGNVIFWSRELEIACPVKKMRARIATFGQIDYLKAEECVTNLEILKKFVNSHKKVSSFFCSFGMNSYVYETERLLATYVEKNI